MNGIIISIGDELVLGQTVNTNATWLSRELAALGITVSEHITLADDVEAIKVYLQQVGQARDVILATGGLGPTKDDLTRIALAQVLGSALRLHEPTLRQIKQFFEERGREMPDTNRIQAMIPTGCEVLENKLGTACGMQVQIGRAAAFFLPGVPQEMRDIFAGSVKNKLQQMIAFKGTNGVIMTRTLHTVGVGESDIAERLGRMMDRDRNPLINSTAAQGIVSLRINARAKNEVEALCLIEPAEREIWRRLGSSVYGVDDETLAQVVGQLLREQHKTLAVAESCTGGLLGKELTDIAGSSDYFKCGWVVYSNQAKIDMLGVDAETITQYGAVSEQVARHLAERARHLGQADYGIGITGIAGPTGASEDKPVGLVYIAVAEGDNSSVKRHVFPGDREMVRLRTVNMALNMLRKKILPGN